MWEGERGLIERERERKTKRQENGEGAGEWGKEEKARHESERDVSFLFAY